MIKKENLPECPVATTVELIGSKWKLLIIKHLLSGPKRYNELKKELPGISQKVLTASLKSLVKDELVTRKSYHEVPPHVEYHLSEIGQEMQSVIQVMAAFGEDYKKKTSL